jgi:hypothetical protein
VSIGRIIGADLIVIGTVDALRQLRIRVLNTQTAIVVGAALVQLPANINIDPPRQVAQAQQRPPATQQQQQMQTPAQEAVPVVPTPPRQTVRVGEFIDFGGREWRVLAVENDRALVIAQTLVAERRFSSTNGNNIWATSEIRGWLNGEFLHRFTAIDRARINQTSINYFRGFDDHSTSDYIFLLSREEVERYFNNNQERVARIPDGSTVSWPLRSPHGTRGFLLAVDRNGGFNPNHRPMHTRGVRPAMWINL